MILYLLPVNSRSKLRVITFLSWKELSIKYLEVSWGIIAPTGDK